MGTKSSSKANTSSKNNLLFKLITLVIPLFILLLIEVILRLAGYGDNLNLFIQNPKAGYENYMIVNPEVGKKYFQKFEYTAPANDTFLKHKKEGVFRIFVMGSSTVYGFPYDRNLMFSRILDKRLKETYGEENIEVVNTAITAINSFTLLDYGKQIAKHEPDAVLIYAGHNEFYGAFGIGSNETMSRSRTLTSLHINLMNLKLYQMLRNGIVDVAKKMAGNKSKQHGTLMKRIVANKSILHGSDDYNIAMQRYEQNMTDLVKIYTKRNVPVFFSEVVSNVKDIKPFNSVETKDHFSAIKLYNSALESEFVNEFSKAQNKYNKARDYDCIRFRASGEVNDIIKRIVEKEKVNYVPMVEVFETNSANGLIGDNLLTEHVHPNIEGNFLMANTFFNSLYNSELIKPKETVQITDANYFKQNYGYTMLDSLNAIHGVAQLKSYWPFVKDNNGLTDHIKTYKPKSDIDSLAFVAVKHKKVALSDVRLELAKKFEKHKMYERAFNEYNAMVYTNPYIAINYRDAASNLIYLSDLPRAEQYFIKSLKWEESFYANFKLGEIALIKSDYNKAVDYFQKSYELAPKKNRVNILVKSYMALVYAKRNADAKKVAVELKKANAEKYLRIPQKQYVYSNYIPYKTKSQVIKAKEMLAQGEQEKALNVLINSLKVYDSHIAKRIIGEINQELKNYKEAQKYFQEVYSEFKFDPAFLHSVILTLAQNGSYDEAKQKRDELNKLEPNYEHLNELNSFNLN